MDWTVVAHKGFHRELANLSDREASRVKEALKRLIQRLRADHPYIAPSGARDVDVPSVDLEPLRGATPRGSYRLRVGPFRVVLVVLPDEALVLATALAKRDDGTYKRLLDTHERRFKER